MKVQNLNKMDSNSVLQFKGSDKSSSEVLALAGDAIYKRKRKEGKKTKLNKKERGEKKKILT